MFELLVLAGALGVAGAVAVFLAMCFRTVVPTNYVHIAQGRKKTSKYGGQGADMTNVYYAWPSWVPIIGIKVIKLPISVFDIDLKDYPGYDKGRVPFIIDIMAFFRIDNPTMAAERVSTEQELHTQLVGILQGACRSILASSEIEDILEGRSRFGDMFTKAVDEQLKEWGVHNVKNIELMDIRDAKGSNVIENIMAKKKSLIEKESRVTVAENQRAAQEAEIEAKRQVDLSKQQAEQQVGERTAMKERAIGVAAEQAMQNVADEKKTTAEKNMAVKQVNDVRSAEIARDVQVVAAEQEKKVTVVKAEGVKQSTVLRAQGDLEAKKNEAEGVRVEGEAVADARNRIEVATQAGAITLAEKIGQNEGYQRYLVEIRKVEATEKIGIEQAEALANAKLTVVATGGSVQEGIGSISEVLSAKGGTKLGAALEALASLPEAKELLGKIVK